MDRITTMKEALKVEAILVQLRLRQAELLRELGSGGQSVTP